MFGAGQCGDSGNGRKAWARNPRERELLSLFSLGQNVCVCACVTVHMCVPVWLLCVCLGVCEPMGLDVFLCLWVLAVSVSACVVLPG
jgi:hypothetical protein